MLDFLTLSTAIAVGLLFYEAARSLAISVVWRFADWRTSQLRRRVERELRAER